MLDLKKKKCKFFMLKYPSHEPKSVIPSNPYKGYYFCTLTLNPIS